MNEKKLSKLKVNNLILKDYKSFKLPVVQFEPIQPVLQGQNPSVFRHVLQLAEHTFEQFLP